MPPLRKATAYSKKKVTPYTRTSKKKGKSYIKTVPQQKIVKFAMGKEKSFVNGKLLHTLTMVSTENVQVRHNALEACRQFVNKKLETELKGQYYFRIIPYSHHVQRENRMLTGKKSAVMTFDKFSKINRKDYNLFDYIVIEDMLKN